jgi:hypothetical protein
MQTSQASAPRVMPVITKMTTDAGILAASAAATLIAGLIVTSHRAEMLVEFVLMAGVWAACNHWLFREIPVPERIAARAGVLPDGTAARSVASYVARWLPLTLAVPAVFVAASVRFEVISSGIGAIAGMYAGLSVIKAIGRQRHGRYVQATGARLIVRADRRNLTEGDYFLSP